MLQHNNKNIVIVGVTYADTKIILHKFDENAYPVVIQYKIRYEDGSTSYVSPNTITWDPT